METQNSNLVQSNNIFENAEPSDLKFFVATTFLPFSKFLVSHLMEKSSEMNSLKECKKALKIYAITTIVILSLIIGIVSAVTSPPDSLTSRFKTSLEMKVGYSRTPLPRINVPIQKVYTENPSLIDIEENGRITAKKAGSTTVTYLIDGKKLTTDVTITKVKKKKGKKKK